MVLRLEKVQRCLNLNDPAGWHRDQQMAPVPFT
jgi:hypothetical protein